MKTVHELSKYDADALVGYVKVESEKSTVAYVAAAKAIIALVNVLGSRSVAKTALKAGGVSEYAVKNATVMVDVYDLFVRSELATEAWFDALNARAAMAFLTAADQIGQSKIAELGLLKVAPEKALREVEAIADTGLTADQRRRKAEKAAEKARLEEAESSEDSDEAQAAADKAFDEFKSSANTTAKLAIALSAAGKGDAVKEVLASLVAAVEAAGKTPAKAKTKAAKAEVVAVAA